MYNIGIDLGGTNIACAIVDNNGKIIKKDSISTFKERTPKEIIKDMADLSKNLISKSNISLDKINSVGIGIPGAGDYKNGIVLYINNLNFKNINLKNEFQKHLNLPIYIENDANIAAYGEYKFGEKTNYKNFIAITLGTGIGSGIIIDGKIFTGSFNAGAEIGHMVIVKDGHKCTCGRNGCFERYASATALIRDAQKIATKNTNSSLYIKSNGNIKNIDAKMIFELAKENDVLSKNLIDEYIENLAIGLANIINIFQPEVISIGGGISGQKDYLIKPLIEKIKPYTYGGETMFKTIIKTATLGNDAGLIGAAFLHKQQ